MRKRDAFLYGYTVVLTGLLTWAGVEMANPLMSYAAISGGITAICACEIERIIHG